MRSRPSIVLVHGAAVAIASVLVACSPSTNGDASAASAAAVSPVERGRYLTESVAMCADCHTAMLPGGKPDTDHWLQGGTLGFGPPEPLPFFATYAPTIAGDIRLTEAQVATLLETGALPNGESPRIPMPRFRFTAEDARAVAAYLRTLPTAPAPAVPTPPAAAPASP